MKSPAFQFYPKQFFREWKGSRWLHLDPTRTWDLPSAACCYCLYLNGKLAYVGSTDSLQRRMRYYQFMWGFGGSLFTPWGQFDSIVAKVRFSERVGDWAMREISLISRLQPRLNKRGIRGEATRISVLPERLAD